MNRIENNMKLPNQKTATIVEMIEFATQMNGKVHSKKASAVISYCLVNIADLQPLSAIPWQSRKWALPAWREIQRIGVLDRLQLLTPEQPKPLNHVAPPNARIRQLCNLLGLEYHKVNGRTIIVRNAKPVTQHQSISHACDAESKCFDMEIDQNAKPTTLCTLPKS
jgi:hypothetical protein